LEVRVAQVSGKVVVKETGVGIPDLLVVMFDADLAGEKQPEVLGTAIQPGFIDITSKRISQRIGSVLTDAQGKFQLEYDPNDIAENDPERKSELLLTVLAPEEPMEAPGVPFVGFPEGFVGTQLTQRLLYYSYFSRVNSGHVEAAIVRLTKKILQEHAILYPGGPVNDSQVVDIAAEQAKADAAREALERQTKLKVQARLEQTKEVARVVELALGNFSLLDPALLAHPLFVATPNQLPAAQTKVVARGLDTHFATDVAAPRFDGLILDIAPTWLTLLTHLSRNGGSSVERAPDLLARCKNKLKSRQMTSGVTEAIESHSGVSGEIVSATTPEVIANSVQAQIERLTNTTTAPEVQVRYDVKANTNIDATIKGFSLSGGAADQPSFHDFQSIRMAFQDIWSQVSDGQMGDLIRSAVTEITKKLGQDAVREANIKDIHDLRKFLTTYRNVQYGEAIPEVVRSIGISEYDVWNHLNDANRAAVIGYATQAAQIKQVLDKLVPSSGEQSSLLINLFNGVNSQNRFTFTLQYDEAVKNARQIVTQASQNPTKDTLESIFAEIDQKLYEGYDFKVFAKDSFNYGLHITYRQLWEPRAYQVGRLTSTLPLAPKESRKYTTKQVRKLNRSKKDLEDSVRSGRSESSSTNRAESEIVAKASEKTSFNVSAQVGLSLGPFSSQITSSFGKESALESSDTKKNFREAVRKSADEYRQQNRVEVEVSSQSEFETVTSSEVMNPNDEISVTYLFYELERQYEISEKLHRVRPVVLVANEVPTPDQINEVWLMTHAWILRRVVLDESFVPILDYVVTGTVGDQLALEAMQETLKQHRQTVNELTKQVQEATKLAEKTFDVYSAKMGLITKAEDLKTTTQSHFDPVVAMFTGFFGGQSTTITKTYRGVELTGDTDAFKRSSERADARDQDVQSRLTRETSALQQATEKYMQATKAYFDRQTSIANLRIHVKRNILHYMQAIWDYEQSDQRYFRLYNVQVDWFEAPDSTTAARPTAKQRPLHEIADLDEPLGYKGNYTIYPVKEPNLVHLVMLRDYLDEEGMLKDPDDFANHTVEELIEYLGCVKEHDPGNTIELNKVTKRIADMLSKPRNDKETIVIPTGQLYIECLPGKHAVMEDFKLLHRALDVKKVQAEVRHAELENVRLSARLLAEHPLLEDPDIEKVVKVEGNVHTDLDA
jgi:hypothetical protein